MRNLPDRSAGCWAARRTFDQMNPAMTSTSSCWRSFSTFWRPTSGLKPSSSKMISILWPAQVSPWCSSARLTPSTMSWPITAAGVVRVVTKPILNGSSCAAAGAAAGAAASAMAAAAARSVFIGSPSMVPALYSASGWFSGAAARKASSAIAEATIRLMVG